MSLINTYFGKQNIDEISYADIVSFFSIERKESDRIEFKSFDITESNGKGRDKFEKDQLNNILETIVAFLNSDGGILIWGAPKGILNETNKEKAFIGKPTFVPYQYGDDQIISKITDKINPNPNRIRKKIIQEGEGFIYVFEVEKSEYSPHQVNNIFYMRIDGATKPAPYHYIDALFKKTKYPDIRGYIKIEKWSINKEHIPMMPKVDDYHLRISAIIFNFSKLQNDYNLSYNILIDLGVFQNSKSLIQNSNTNYAYRGKLLRRINVKDIVFYGEPITESYTIVLTKSELSSNNYQIKINLFFGTKSSPMKCSRYTIDLNQKNVDEPNKTMFIEISENLLMSEFKEELGQSDKDSLEAILLR